MKATEQTQQQIERLIAKVADKFPTAQEPTIMTDIHLRANQETGELVAFDDDDNEITRVVVEQWIGNTDDDFYASAATALRKCLGRQKAKVETLAIIKPYAFVLEDEDKEPQAELYVADDDTVIIDPEMMPNLDKELDSFLDELLKK